MSEIVQPRRFCGVLCMYAQLTRCFSAVAELLVFNFVRFVIQPPDVDMFMCFRILAYNIHNCQLLYAIILCYCHVMSQMYVLLGL